MIPFRLEGMVRLRNDIKRLYLIDSRHYNLQKLFVNNSSPVFTLVVCLNSSSLVTIEFTCGFK